MAIDYVASALGTDRGPKSKLPDDAGHLLNSVIIFPRGNPPAVSRVLRDFYGSLKVQ